MKTIKNLPAPTSQVKEILYDLITYENAITESDYQYHMFRGHLSNLRKRIAIEHKDVPFVNRFKRKGKYRVHWLRLSEKVKATKYYLSLFKK